MIRAIVLASVSFGVLATNSPTGLSSCACLGALPSSIPDIDCTYDWAFKGKCVKAVGLVSNFTTYAADYGESCKIQKEPGSSSCFDITKTPPEEKATANQANWCNQKWCYIDPCKCDASDATKSDYFPDVLFYSYATCGDKNTYTALESASNTVGNAECSNKETTAAAKTAAPTGTTAAAKTAAPTGTTAAAGGNASAAADLVPSMMLAAILVLISA
jgi:hypothetical protein